jgi:arylsulfatase A-like enzyme
MRTAWLPLLLSAALPARAADAPAAAPRPNLLILHTDEHNFRTLGCYRALLPKDQAFVWGDGVAVETPHIDSIAKAGLVCDRFYTASPVCTPSRASFVSGCHPCATGAPQNDLPMRDDVVTFAEVLRRAGYATGYAGKWHLDGPARPGWAPARRFGFDDNRFMFNRGHWKQLEETPQGPRVKAVNAQGRPTYAVEGADAASFTTDWLADRAVAFIREHQGGPFCYMVSFPDPHGPNAVRAPYDTMFKALKFEVPGTANEAGEGLPSWATPGKAGAGEGMARYFGMVKCIDDNVGKILAALREAGVADRTAVVFTADHGDMCGEHGRVNKGIPLEGSARVPFVMSFPGTIPPGTVVREALTTTDFKPTVLRLLGAESAGRTDGRDASALFRGEKPAAGWRGEALLRIGGEGAGWVAVVTRRHKLVFSPDDPPCLFDLEADPFELKNRFRDPACREIVRSLARALLERGRAQGEPHLEEPAVRADLAWAADGTGEYAAPTRADDGGRAGRKKRRAAAEEEE